MSAAPPGSGRGLPGLAERAGALAYGAAGRALLEVWRVPGAADTLAEATGWGIAGERLLRELVCPPEEHAGRPVVHWHEGGEGPALLLLNGFSGSGLTWPTGWIRRLEERYRVIRVDNRGTGWSRRAPAPFTVADMADDAAAVLRSCGVDRAVVLGFSMGGMIAQEMAMRQPALVEKLVLVSTIPPAPAWVCSRHGIVLSETIVREAAWAARDDPDPDRDLLARSARVWQMFAARSYVPLNGVFDEIGRQTLRRVTPRRGVVMQARAINAWRGPQRLTAITTPATVVHGMADRAVVADNARRLCALIPHARPVLLPDVGHLLPWEAGDELAEVLTSPSPHRVV